MLKFKINLLYLQAFCINKLYHETRVQFHHLSKINIQYVINKRYFSQQQDIQEQDVIKNNNIHVPAMIKEVLLYLQPSPGKIYVDMTFGAGGHTTQILKSAPDIKIFTLDRDPIAYNIAQDLSKNYPGQMIPLLGKFSDLPLLLSEHKVGKNSIDGFLFDFGCSSMQFDNAERGFSLSKNGPLDMRMDGNRYPENPTAADVIERADEIDLYHILKIYGQEKKARKIARALIEARYMYKKLETTKELAQLVESVLSNEIRKDQLGRFSHCATKTFQAFRIFVNNELNEINHGIVLAQNYLKIGGCLITISFHSLEDIVVKRHMTGNITDFVANVTPLKYLNHNKSFRIDELNDIVMSPWKMMHKHVLTPSSEEVNKNPRVRSAKFRAITKVK
ncbi:probable methyltransferase-like protein 15 homolog [Vespa velutina]|uniref:probable methyltransferase-like protein 15 homolog n=1 Tax=Vespa velutina TaxID=202808 RepID=UPI001FB52C11|nr:probable methyltransferase-like protein 15 homolog [Vespa velutina]XP_047350757.1 probable methyltransferase-like protein 15 homolog [Vespa velutina]XP_047350759.1 probable methyltransferase-like protein 15 homolog [Vespa velutina]